MTTEGRPEHLKRIRSFIAVNLPIPVVQKIGELQKELRERAQKAGLRVGWVPLPSMHVTLKFLAEIPEESVWAVRDLLRDRLADRVGFLVRPMGAGAFPDPAHPRVLWVGLHCEKNELAALAGEVDDWLEGLGFAREKRPFKGHLTLGRVKSGAADVISGLEQVDLGECSVAEVVLYRSVLRRQGAEYTPLARIPLRQPPGAPRPAAAKAAAPEPAPAEPGNGDDSSPDEGSDPDEE